MSWRSAIREVPLREKKLNRQRQEGKRMKEEVNEGDRSKVKKGVKHWNKDDVEDMNDLPVAERGKRVN